VEVAGSALIVPRPVRVELGGQSYRIPARPAADWMAVLLDKDLADIVPGMLEGDLDALWDRVFDGEVTTAECEEAAKAALSAVAGTPWWVAVKLVHSAAADPGVIGELRSSGADITTLPLGAVLAALYRIYTRDRDPKDVAKVDAEIAKLPPGVSAVEARYNEAAAAAAFEARFAERGGR